VVGLSILLKKKFFFFNFQKKQALMKNLLSPIATKFESLLTKLVAETNQEKQLAYAQSINTATALAR
jgi:hypothetical protein